MYRPGATLAQRYRLDERVGGGGMGEVWRGTDTALERTVAVKTVRGELLDEPGFRERFRTEARTMARIRHPGVVAVHDYYSDEAGAFLVMEFVEGEALSGLLRRVGRLDPDRAMALVAEASEALQAAHDRGVVHRDIKPGNLMVSEDGKLVLTDFGIARSAASTSLTATGALLGTASYLAPEQVLGRPADARSDVYALGVVAYECLSGRRPFDGDNPFDVAMRRLREPPPTMAVQVPPAVLAVVERALAAEPEQRYQSAAELATAARRCVGAAPGAAPVPPASPAPAPAAWPGYGPPATPTTPGYPPSPPSGYPPSPPPGYPARPPPGYPPGPPVPGPPAPVAYPGGGYQVPVHGVAAHPRPVAPPRPPKQPGDTLGLVGMILGIIGIPLFCCYGFGGLFGLAAAILGGLGLKKVSEGQATNRGQALAAVICGAIAFVIGGGYLMMIMLGTVTA